MSNSAKTIYYFSFYLFILGAALVVVPNLLLQPFGIPPTEEVWIRIVGMLILMLGVLYFNAAKLQLHGLYKFMAYNRIAVLFFLIAFVLLGWTVAPLIIFGVIDAASGIWTLSELRKEGRW